MQASGYLIGGFLGVKKIIGGITIYIMFAGILPTIFYKKFR
jgi:hypothetical protein